MVAINFFQPNTVDISLSFPQEWNELLPEELEAISRAQLEDQEIEGADKVQVLQSIITIRAKDQAIILPADFFQKLDTEDAVINGLPLLDFIYDSNSLTKQPYPILEVTGTRYEGREDDFNNITCGEYEDCEIFFNQFKAEPDPEPLARLAAVLYRPKAIPYISYNAKSATHSHYNVEKVFADFLALDGAILFTIFTWYTGCRQRLPQLFPTAFKTDGTSSDEPDFIAFTKCIHSAAGPKNGSRNVIRTTLLKEFFLELELEAEKAEAMRKQYEELKNRR